MRRMLIGLFAMGLLLGFAPTSSRSVEAAPGTALRTEVVYLSLSGLT